MTDAQHNSHLRLDDVIHLTYARPHIGQSVHLVNAKEATMTTSHNRLLDAELLMLSAGDYWAVTAHD